VDLLQELESVQRTNNERLRNFARCIGRSVEEVVGSVRRPGQEITRCGRRRINTTTMSAGLGQEKRLIRPSGDGNNMIIARGHGHTPCSMAAALKGISLG
jgi:hypothetical protein